MSYALEKWDRLISSTIHPDNLLSLVGNNGAIQMVIDQSEMSREKVRKQMIKQAFSVTKEKAMEVFVQQHQSVLIRLLEKTCQYLQTPELDGSVQKMYEQVSGHLEAVLDFIEHYFTKYFNQEERVHAPYLNVVKKEIKAQLPTCINILKLRPDTDDKLTEILCSCIGDFCSDGYLAYTFRDLIYYKELVQQVTSMGSNGKVDHVYSALKELFIYLNFNAPLFISYFLSQIHKELEAFSGSEAKIERLALHQKNGQMQLKPGFALHSEFPSVSETLIEVLQKEIEYLSTIRTKVLAAPEGSVVELPERVITIELVTVPFKVPEIYLLNKAFVDSGGAPTETYKSLLKK